MTRSRLFLSGAISGISRRRQRLRRGTILRLMATGLGLLGLAVWQPLPPFLYWNASASAPRGLYWLRQDHQLARGDWALVRLPEPWRQLATTRGYLPPNVPLIKPVAALTNDAVCAVKDTITINGSAVARRLLVDTKGRVLPSWQGCYRLQRSQVFLLNQAVPASFDGRYFGPIGRDHVIGRVTPLLIFRP